MDVSIVQSALGLVITQSVPIAAAALIACMVFGLLQAATQIQDEAISYAGKLFAICLVLAFLGAEIWSEILEFSLRIWGGSDFYL